MAPPRRDFGCPNDVHRLSVSTNYPPGATYKWQIDGGPIVSTKDYYNYTFDNKYHALTVTVSSGNCQIVTKINMHGRDCVQCTTECLVQSSTFPAGNILWLTDEQGIRYMVEPGIIGVCRNGDNRIASTAVKRAIKNQSKCENDNLRTLIYYNQSGRDCLTLTIYNSPVRFQYLRVGSLEYLFDKSRCQN